MKARRHRSLTLALGILFLLALTPRLLYQHQASTGPLWDRPVLDEAYNHRWAATVAAGEAGPAPPYFRAPLYPWFLAAVYRVAGAGPGAGRIAQALLSGFTCLGVALLGLRLYGKVAAAAAGLLAAGYWPWIYFDGELQDVPLTLAWNVLGLLLVLRGGEAEGRAGGPGAVAAVVPIVLVGMGGVAFGLSAITRPTILIVLPVVVWWLLRRRDGAGRRRLIHVAAFGIGVALPVAPITALNVGVGGDTVLIASQGGLNFYLGNNADSDGHSARLPGASREWEEMIQEGVRRAEVAEARLLRPSEVSRYWFRQGLGYWQQEPAAAAGLTLRKAGMLLSAPERPNNKQILYFTERYAPMMRLPWPGFGIVAPLALIGFLWGRGRPGIGLLAAVTAAYACGVIAFFVAARFRMPVAVLLIPAAGGGVQALHRMFHENRRALGSAIAVLLVAGLAIQLPGLGYRENEAHAHYMLGNAHRDRGDLDRAVSEFDQALGLDPGFREARRNLGAALILAGRADEAIARLAPALEGDPGDAESRVNLALAFQATGRPEEARSEMEAAVREVPSAAHWMQLGNLRSSQGDHAGAASAFQEALDREPGSVPARFNLANELLRAGRPADAEAFYADLVRRSPDHAGAWTNLGVALQQMGRSAEAVEVFRRGLEADPSSLPARLALAGALRDVGRIEAARRELEALLRLAPEGDAVRREAAAALEELRADDVSG